MNQTHGINRRAFLGTAAKAAVLGVFVSTGTFASARASRAGAAEIEPPLIWVWKFNADGDLRSVRDTLRDNGLGIILKTHDGTHWMDNFDDSPDAVTGPAQVSHLATSFGRSGIPFHNWCVVQGKDPVREAAMAAQVLDAGAQSLFLDLEPPEDGNYWQGTARDALAFGEELRRLKPRAKIVLAPDARPWQMSAVPLAEFMSFSDAVAPQSYWRTFNGPSNVNYLRKHGYTVTDEGFTPELAAEVAAKTFAQFGRPIQPIGQGAANRTEWSRFLSAADSYGLQVPSLWRYGTAGPGILPLLMETAGRAPDGVRVPNRQEAEQYAQRMAELDSDEQWGMALALKSDEAAKAAHDCEGPWELNKAPKDCSRFEKLGRSGSSGKETIREVAG